MKVYNILLCVMMLVCVTNLKSQEEDSKFNVFLELGSARSTIKNRAKIISNYGGFSNKETSDIYLISGVGVGFRFYKNLSLKTGINTSIIYSAATVGRTPLPVEVSNWYFSPEQYFTQSSYQLINIPVEIKYDFLRRKKLNLFLTTGLSNNMVMDYRCFATELYYDGSEVEYRRDMNEEYFGKFNLSVLASFGIDYFLTERFYVSGLIYYSHMLSFVKEQSSWKEYNLYQFKLNESAIKIQLGYKF